MTNNLGHLGLIIYIYIYLQKAEVSMKLDVRSTYNLEGDEWKTAFSTTASHCHYQVMPYGLARALNYLRTYSTNNQTGCASWSELNMHRTLEQRDSITMCARIPNLPCSHGAHPLQSMSGSIRSDEVWAYADKPITKALQEPGLLFEKGTSS